ncbi:single-stranded DNA-binding protein [mine drainage metagenome]|uniref:Single-stranded DNA-binding protein n=1 Tax=mine drainage metagenome TaxID=410659 RepID=A0A1J5RC15_9ZZZZ
MEITARVTANAVVKTVKNERKVVNFNVAINDSYKIKDSNEIKKVVQFVQCSYWINPGIAEYLTKGTLVELYGRIGVNAYNDLQGEAKAALTFHVNTIKLHGRPKAEQAATESGNNNKDMQENKSNSKKKKESINAKDLTEPLDDLPF